MKMALAFILFFLCSYVTVAQKIQPKAPAAAMPISKSQSSISYVFVPIRIKIDDLSGLISKNLPKTYSGSISQIKEGQYIVYLDDLKPSIQNNNLSYNIAYKKGIASGVLGITVSGKTAGVSANINSLKGDISLNPNLKIDGYQLSTSLDMTNTVEHAEMQACKYIGWPIDKNMCSMSVPVTSMVDQSIEKQINSSKSRIESNIQSELNKLNLQGTANNLWKGFYRNAALDTASKLWLMSRPKRIFMSEPEFTEEYVEFGMGLNLSTIVDSSALKITKKPLPKPLSTSRKKGYYKCVTPSFVSYDYLEDFLNEKYDDYIIYHEGKKFMKLKEIKIYGSKNNELIIGFKVSGIAKSIKKARGWVYVTAQIELVENDYTMRVKSYDLDAETNNFLVNAGLELIANKTHYKRFLADLKYDLKPQLHAFQKQVNTYLKKGFKTDYGSITGSLNEMSFTDFTMARSGISIYAKLIGSLDPFYVDLSSQH